MSLFRDWSFFSIFPADYRRGARRPVNPKKAVFVSEKLATMPDSFTLMEAYLREELGFETAFVGLGKSLGIGNVEYYRRCRACAEDLADARLIFLDDAARFVSSLPIRPETKVVQLWHACGAFKKWGASTADLKFGDTLEQIKRHPYYENLSLVTVSSPEVAWAYRQAMLLEDTPDVVQGVGVSRTDLFFDDAFVQGACNHVNQAAPACKGKKALLYAPTFRGMVGSAQAPDAFDLRAAHEALGDEWVVLVKQHPFVKNPPAIPADCAAFACGVDKVPIAELLVRADLLVTDYSSVVFEYSLMGRPMAFFAYDKADYDGFRGFYYDYSEMTPGPVVSNMDELAVVLSSIDEWFDAAQVDRFKEKFMSACDGHATERIARIALT